MNVMTKGEMAKHLRSLADAPSITVENRKQLELIADEIDPPKPKIDRTVRGLVEVRGLNGVVQAAYACDRGISDTKGAWVGGTPWEHVDNYLESIRPIRELKPGQVAVDISTLRYLVRVAEESLFNISEHFDRSVAVSDAKNAIAEAERMEAW